MKLYSQNNEQGIILDWFKNQPEGKFLDVGAYDGVTFSNTRALAEKGWSGVCVEGSPTACAKLLDSYHYSQKVHVVNAVVGGETSWNTFYDAAGDAISTLNHGHKSKWSASAKYRPVLIRTIEVVDLIACVGLDFDFISVDLEGDNLAFIHRLIKLGPRASLYCIEHDGQMAQLNDLMLSRGYCLCHKNTENVIYGRPR